jgi:hypothetical protein
MRIRVIALSWFRGAADPVALKLDCNSMVVYGANASGKSSFVDAIEFVFNGSRISHLAHEYSGKYLQKAVPNTHKPRGAKTELSIEFCDGLDIKTEIKEDGSTTSSGSGLGAIGTWEYRRTVLRQSEVAAFIQDTKGGKYSALLPLLGLHPMEIAAENLRQVTKNIESLSNLEQIKKDLRQSMSDRATVFGAISDEEILAKIENLHSKYCPGELTAKGGLLLCADLTNAIEKLSEYLSADQKRYLCLRDIAEIEMKESIEAVRAASVSFAGAADPLIAQKLAVLQQTENFVGKLREDAEVTCPACGRLIKADTFREHVRSELDRLKVIRDTFNQRNLAIGTLCDSIKSLKREFGKSEVRSWRDGLAGGVLAECASRLDAINAEALRATCTEENLREVEEKLLPLIGAAASASVEAPVDVSQLWEDKRLVDAARGTLAASERAAEAKRAETLIFLCENLEHATREEIRRRSTAVIAEISDDIRDMWAILHPDESIEDVRLHVPETADKAIDIRLKFHGKDLDSPRLTLSEGYRNGLGLCVFLAMAKRDSANDRPVFLDDVVVSLDRNHRGMIVELLRTYFASRQVVILTHDRDWYTELRQQLDDGAWTFKTLLPYDTPETGIRWSDKSTTFGDAYAHVKERPDSAVNDARKIMDVELALIAEGLKISLPYLRFEKNDRRTAHEFLERLIADGKKCFHRRVGANYTVYEDAIAALKQADQLLITWANRGSHGFDVVPSEAIKLIQICEKALGCFICESCGKKLWSLDAATQEWVQCHCGNMRWRYGKA